MSIIFNADEVLEMAEQIERNGAAFYRRAAEINPEHKALLEDLADQEDQHLALFQGMRKELSEMEATETAFDPNQEASLYLKAMADGHIFDLNGNDAASLLKGNENIDDIISIAIQAEKDSIVFFVTLRDLVPPALGKDRLEALIQEETKHIHWLVQRKVS